MAYTPQLIINYEHLKEHQKRLTIDECSNNDNIVACARELHKAFNAGPVTIAGVRLVLIHPEFSTINEKIRNYMDELGIEYAEDN